MFSEQNTILSFPGAGVSYQAARIPSGAGAPPTDRVLGEMAGRGEIWKINVSGSKMWKNHVSSYKSVFFLIEEG